MELPLESVAAPLSNFRPKTGSMEAWNAAYVRVEDYLRAHRIHNRLHQSRLIQKILERAARRHAGHPALDPTTFAAEEAEAMMNAWFSEVLGERNQPGERTVINGRLALLLSDGAQKWPYAFLDEDNIPAEFSQAMQAGSIQAGPDLAVSSMVPRPIELGAISEAAGETLERFEKWPLLRALFLWAIFLAALALIFRATR
ncbi:MAG TPA: hypothetical protein VK717_12085 [Opitutaceae bacterium]|jgi:hypothetical protein|nr:hypothetical protein [Opitutaceae bacterium]